MKKVLAIILAILMALTFFACATSETPAADPSADTPADTAADTAADTPADTPEDAPADTPADAPDETVADITVNENDLGYFNSGVDPFSRDKYTIVWMYPRTMALMQNIADVLTEWGEKLNYDLIASTGDGDIDVFIQQMELYANQGADGFLLNFDVNSRFRIKK